MVTHTLPSHLSSLLLHYFLIKVQPLLTPPGTHLPLFGAKAGDEGRGCSGQTPPPDPPTPARELNTEHALTKTFSFLGFLKKCLQFANIGNLHQATRPPPTGLSETAQVNVQRGKSHRTRWGPPDSLCSYGPRTLPVFCYRTSPLTHKGDFETPDGRSDVLVLHVFKEVQSLM